MAMMVPTRPPAACPNWTTLSPSWWTRSAVMLIPRTGPTAGSTVDRVVTITPQMVMELPHHLAGGAAGDGVAGEEVSVGMGVGPFGCFGWGTRGGIWRLMSLASASVASTRASQPLPKRQKVG